MSLTTLEFPQPVRQRHTAPPRDYACRDRAIEWFEAGRPLAAVHESLRYLLGEVGIPDLATAPMCFVQGSARIRIELIDAELRIASSLAALTSQSQATAALRYVLTRLSATGQLFQPRLRGETIVLEFREQLALLHPQKLLEVLQRLPTEADRNDQWLADAFAVATPDREPIAPLDAGEFERAASVWDAHWTNTEELLKESRRRRSLRFLDALGHFAVCLPRYALPLHGTLRQRLSEAADSFADRDETPNKREAALAKCVKEMRQAGHDLLRQCLGHARFAINPQHEGTTSLLNAMLGSGQHMQNIGELLSGGRSMDAALILAASYLDLLAHQSWSVEIETALRAGLDRASGKPWRDAADTLWQHAHALVRRFCSHETGADGNTATSAEYSE